VSVLAQSKTGGNVTLSEFVVSEMNSISDLKMQLRKETAERFGESAVMLSAPEQCEHMKFIVKAAKCRKGIEVGVFTGYSALCFAEALPEDGKLRAFDVSEEFMSIGKKYWKLANLDHKIDISLEGGDKGLDSLIALEGEQSYDFAYIDADKPNYPVYFEKIIRLLKRGGFVMVDNILWKGHVADPEKRKNDVNTKTCYELTKSALGNKELDTHVINIADGLLISYKK